MTREEATERFYELLHWQLAARLPRPGGVHIYSKGKLYSGFYTVKNADGYKLIISNGVDYARFAMGYKDDGSKRIARTTKTGLEEYNFKTIDYCIQRVSAVVASTELGGVFLDGNKLY